ncbi:MAG TPA: alpha/beta fold hydrolase [Planctomycetota bacterium]|nr:alpha/beta fold hydrolase [Planctomycetota bacterium]
MFARRFAVGLCLLVLAATAVRAQPVDNDPSRPGSYTINKKVSHVSLEDDKISFDVLRPEGAPAGPRPTIVLVPGLGCQPENYMQVSFWLVSHGFNVALFKFEGNENDDAPAWDAALKKAVDKLEAEDKDKTSELYDTMDFEKLGIMGHSLGGAVATLAAARDSRFKALAVFGPGAIDKSFLDKARNVKGATIAIDAGLDRITPPEEYGGKIVSRANTPYKSHIVVTGGAHPNSPADFDADYIRDTPRVVWKPNPAFFYWLTPTVEVPILKDIKPIDSNKQRALGFPFLTAWMERFVAGESVPAQWLDGSIGTALKDKGLLDKATFSDAVKDEGLPAPAKPADDTKAPGKPADIGKGTIRDTPRPVSPGLIRALDRAKDASKDDAR